MTEECDAGVWQPSTDCVKRVKEMSLPDAEFASLTGAKYDDFLRVWPGPVRLDCLRAAYYS